jgi:cell division control protein 45
MGAIIDLTSPEWFGEFSPKMTVHIIDSARPLNLSSLFSSGQNGERIIVWDDGDAEKLQEERKAWEALMYEPEPDSDDDDESEDDLEDQEDEDEDEDDYEYGTHTGKRRSIGDGERKSKGKRRRVDDGDVRSSS